jgi:shikimate dehydrogenase
MKEERLFGLIGYPLGHSFSKRYFSEKFDREGRTNHRYELFPLEHLEALPALLHQYPHLQGLNVTIPYKEQVLAYCDWIHPEALAIGAVNTLKIQDGRLEGYNSDVFGFKHSLLDWLPSDNRPAEALVLGTGGAAKAVGFVLSQLGISFQMVSRNPERAPLTYEQLTRDVIQNHHLIINTTPLGMAPDTTKAPDLPYQLITANHYIYDLIYNPAETRLMHLGKARGAEVKNGLEMLYLQAERSWSIWNDQVT